MQFTLDGVGLETENEEYWIAPTAVLVGKVRLEAEASVWWGAVLRGDTELITVGRRSNVQDNCVLHTDEGFPLTIGPDVTVGHLAILHGCTIGEGTLIGMGAVILNGARIGRNCLIGAKAFVSEGKEIPDNSLVKGFPGKVAGEIGPEQTTPLLESAASYVRRWKRYRAGMRGAAPG
jgi:carbonic anhydrase/acetyltransferase-like protein (isoleucine patch superfamily)